jgi:hypothetical protein
VTSKFTIHKTTKIKEVLQTSQKRTIGVETAKYKIRKKRNKKERNREMEEEK